MPVKTLLKACQEAFPGGPTPHRLTIDGDLLILTLFLEDQSCNFVLEDEDFTKPAAEVVKQIGELLHGRAS